MEIGVKDGIALILAICGYALWYRIDVGPWCPAMWHGTAPPVIILGSYVFLRRIIYAIAARAEGRDRDVL